MKKKNQIKRLEFQNSIKEILFLYKDGDRSNNGRIPPPKKKNGRHLIVLFSIMECA